MLLPMPDRTLPPNVPKCHECGGVGTAKLETTLKGVASTQMWKCARCGYSWPVKAYDAA